MKSPMTDSGPVLSTESRDPTNSSAAAKASSYVPKTPSISQNPGSLNVGDRSAMRLSCRLRTTALIGLEFDSDRGLPGTQESGPGLPVGRM